MKKVLSIVIIFTLVFSTIFPVNVAFAASAASVGSDMDPNVELCIKLGLLQGDAGGIDASYWDKTPTKLQAAMVFLKLKGLESVAATYIGSSNYIDANSASWAKPYMSYIKENPQLSFPSSFGEVFDPNSKIDSNYYYAVLLTALGYKVNTADTMGDFSLSDATFYGQFIGLKTVDSQGNFTMRELAAATVEALNAVSRGEKETLVNKYKKYIGNTLASPQSLDNLKILSAKAVSNRQVEVKLNGNYGEAVLDKGIYHITDLNVISVMKDTDKSVLLQTEPQKSNVDYSLKILKATATFKGKAENKQTPEMVGKIVCIDTDLLEIRFNTPMDRESAEEESNYIANNGLTVIAATLDISKDADRKTVLLKTEGMKGSKGYRLNIENVLSADMVKINGVEKSFTGVSDTKPPKIAGEIEVINNQRIRVRFNDAHGIDKESAEEIPNWSITTGEQSLTIKSILALDDDQDSLGHLDMVELETEPMQQGREYKLSVSNISDNSMAKNIMAKTVSSSFVGVYPDKTKPYISKITVLDNYRIAVDFVERNRMDRESMMSEGNYGIDKNIDITSVRQYGITGDPKSVILDTSGLEKKTYKLTIENISDEFGNIISKTAQSITGKEADLKPPYITKTNWIDDETVEIFFSEKVDVNTAENLSNYLLDGSQGKVKKAKLTIIGDACKVILTTMTQQPNTTYGIVINGIADIAGNEMSNAKEYFVSRGTVLDTGDTAIESIYAVSKEEVQVVFNKAMRVDKTSLPIMTLSGGILLKFSGALLDGGKKAVFIPQNAKFLSDGNKEYIVELISDIKDINDKVFVIAGNKPTFTGTDSENIPAKVKSIEQVDYSTIKIKLDKPIQFSSLALGDIASIKPQKGSSFSAYIDYKEEDTNDAEATLTLKYPGKLQKENELIFNLRNSLEKGGFIQDYSGNLVNNSTTWDTTSITTYVQDTEGPKIQNVEAIDASSFKVTYDESISKNYPGTYGIYKATSSGGTSQVVTGTSKVDTKDESMVIVTFSSTNIKEGESYVVKPISAARDLAGNSAAISNVVFDYTPSYNTDSDYIKGVAIVDSKVIKVLTKKTHTLGDKIKVLDERGLNIIDTSKNGEGIISGIKGSGTDELTIYLALPLLKATSYKVDLSGGKLTYNFTYDSNATGENPVFIGEVKASPAAGLIELKKTVTLSTDTEGAEIRYTTDGTDPDLTSQKYEGPMVINSQMTIKAVAVKAGAVSSGISVFEYTLKPDSIPPILTGVTSDNVIIGENVRATSNEDGYIYLVPSTIGKNWIAIEAAGKTANGTYVLATPNTSVSLSTASFAPGTYMVYAVDPLLNISESSPWITVTEPLKAAPELIPTVATVDGDFGISFIDNAAWRTAIKEVKLSGVKLEETKDYSINLGSILLKPSANILLQTPGEKEITIVAEGYADATITQMIQHGVVSRLVIIAQPVAPIEDRMGFAVQPVIKLQDKYGNSCTTNNTTQVTASKEDGGLWELKGLIDKNAINGVVTFVDLSTKNLNLNQIPGAKIKFTAGALSIISEEFMVPKKVAEGPTFKEVTNATVDTAFEIVIDEFIDGSEAAWKAAMRAIKVNGYTLPTGAYDKTIAGKIIIRPSMDTSLQTTGLKNIVIEATGYTAVPIEVNIKYGVAKRIGILTQPQTPPGGDKILKVQPVLKLQDQYGNDCTGDSTTKITANKADAGNWVIGSISGLPEATAVNGIVTFTGLTADRSMQVSGAKLSFRGTGITSVESVAFNIVAPTLPMAPTLTPADDAIVDDATIRITFPSSTEWSTAIKQIKVNGSNLDAAAFTKSDGNIMLKPSMSALLQSAGTKTIIVEAEGYAMACVSQSIGHGMAKKIAITVQPKSPAVNGTILSTQPKVKLLDQYDNDCTTDSMTEVIAQTADATWTMGGKKNIKAINGLVSFNSLTAGSATQMEGAKIEFTGNGLASIISEDFRIPTPISSGNETTTIDLPADGFYANADITLIKGQTSPNMDSNKTSRVKVSIKDSANKYLTKNKDGFFISGNPVYLDVVGTGPVGNSFSTWEITLDGVGFGNSTYTIEATAFDGEDGPTSTSVFTTKMNPADGITINMQNIIQPNGSATLTVRNGPLSDASWVAIRNEIKDHIGGTDPWITGIAKGDLLLTPNEDGMRAILKNTNSINAAILVKDFTITKTNVIDRAGNVALSNIVIDANADPGVINNVTATNNDGSYKAGQNINMVVTFSSAVNVVGGTPRIKMNTGNTVEGYGKYVSGSGTTELKFTYTVQPGDNIADLNYLDVNSLEANGATIKNKLPAIDAILTLPAPTAGNSLGGNKNITLDTIAPSNISISHQNIIEGLGEVTLTVEGGPLSDDSWAAIANQIKANTTGGENWILGIPADKLAITSMDNGNKGILKNNNNSNATMMKDFAISSSNIYDKAGNNAASTLTIDSYIETSSVVAVNAGEPNGTYKAGKVIPITVTFNDYVVLTGAPSLRLNTGGTALVMAEAEKTKTLSFNYIVQPGENAAKLDYLAADSLKLNGGSINCFSPAGLEANIMLPAPATAGSLGVNKIIVIDTQSPQLDANSGVALSGDHKKVTLTFSEAILTDKTNAELKAAVKVDKNDGNGLVNISADDSVTIVAGKLEIAFKNPLTAERNIIQLGANIFKDAIGNINESIITTNEINAAADITPPTIVTAVVDGSSPDKLVLTFNETLADITPVVTDFTLGDSESRKVIAVAGNGFNKTVTLTLSKSLTVGQTIIVNYVKGTNGIQDLSGNKVLDFSKQVSNAVPEAAKVTEVSAAIANGSYNANSTIDITVKFHKAVDVLGTPKLQLETGVIDSDAMYFSGTGTDTLTFRYIIKSGDVSSDLNYTNVGALMLNGGTIKNKDMAVNANLSLLGLLEIGSLGYNKEIVIDTAVPVLLSARVENTGKNLLILKFGEKLSGTIHGSQFTIGGRDGDARTVTSAAIDVLDETKVVLTLSTDLSSGNEITVSYIEAGNPIKDMAGNKGAAITNYVVVNDVQTPAVITHVTSTMPDGTYGEGYSFDIIITFNGEVDVIGYPTLKLNAGATSTATYEAGTGTKILTFKYVTKSGDTTGIGRLSYDSVNSLVGNIKNKGREVAASLTLPALNSPDALVVNKNIVIDTQAPIMEEPTQDSISKTSVTVGVQANENAIIYYVVLSQGAPAPSFMQVKLGVDGTGNALLANKKGMVALNANTLGKLFISELDPTINHSIYITAEDRIGNLIQIIKKLVIENKDLGYDTTPPEFVGEPTSVTNDATETTAKVLLKANERGRAYYVILNKGAAAPNASQVKNGTDSSYIAVSTNRKGRLEFHGNIETTMNITNLAPDTEYEVYLVIEDGQVPANFNATTVKKVNIQTKPSDKTPPIFIYTPVGGSKTDTTANMAVKLNEASTVYYAVVPGGANPPNIAQVKEGKDANNTALASNKKGTIVTMANVDTTISITGLTKGTSYDVYLIAEDNAITPNIQTSTVKINIVTDSVVDIVPPILLPGYPIVEAKDNTAMMRLKANETGKAYYVVLSKGAATPTITQIKAGANAAIIANTEASIHIAGLSNGTQYDLYVICEDSATNKNSQMTATKITFATSLMELTGVTVDVAAGKINGTRTTMEFSIDSTNGTNGNWNPCTDGSTTVTFIPTNVYIRDKAQITNYRMVAKITVESIPSTSGITYDVALGTITGMKNNMQYKVGTKDWADATVGGVTTGVVFAQGTVAIRLKATAYSLPSNSATLGTILAPASAPNLDFDDNANTIPGLDGSFEYKIGGGLWTPGNISGDFSGAKIVSVRSKATATALASSVQTITFTVDNNLNIVKANISANQLTGTNANMEYSLNGINGTWIPCTDTTTTVGIGFIAGDVYVRDKTKTSNYRLVIEVVNSPNVVSIDYSILNKSITNNTGTPLQYRIAGGSWIDTTGITTNNVAFVAGKLEFRTKCDEVIKTSLMVQKANITSAAPAPLVTANIIGTNATLNIGSIPPSTLEWSNDGGIIWTTYNPPFSMDPGSDLRVRIIATPTTLPSQMTNKLNY